MNRLKKMTSVLVLAGVGTTGFMFGNGWIRETEFARAQQQVQTSREQLESADDLAGAFRGVGKALEPSVVSIRVTKTVRGMARALPFDEEMLRRFFPDRDGDGEPDLPEGFGESHPFEQMGTGSGVIMETDGKTAFILTNNHVAGGADEMLITLHDGRQIKNGKLVGTDAKTDLAVIKIESDRLIPAKWGDSDQLQKGDWIVAFGSPFGYVGSMTHGIVSALNRQTNHMGAGILGRYGYENFIQVDAPINPGNSGGPLANLRGEVVGINTAIASRTGGFQGVGFAIPSNQAKFVYSQLKESGKVTRGWLGVGIASVNDPRVSKLAESFGYEKTTGVFVQEVMPNTPATDVLREGDVITQLNGKPVDDVQQLRNQIAAMAPNTDVKMTVFREGKSQDVTIKLGEQPEDLASARTGRGRGSAEEETAAAKGRFGLTLSDASPELIERFGLEKGVKGAVVREVDPRSVAAREGIRPGDVITQVAPGGQQSQKVSTGKEARDALAKADPAKGVRLYVVTPEGSRFVWLQAD